jgi:predicted DNA-binding protein with PD1-like motif
MQELIDGERTVLRLSAGEELFEAFGGYARRHGVRAAIVVEGIGMLREATIGYWNGREYDPHPLSTPYELVGLHGSIAEVDGAPSLHLHATLAGPDHRVVGGHLLHGVVGVIVEAYVTTFSGRSFGRTFDESLGLRTLDLAPGA